MEWAAGTKCKGSFTFLEASPSSHKPSPPMWRCTEASAIWLLESQFNILV
ncbi:hypothetical protein ACE6H2_022826 [Prunus campanulata]